MPARQPIYREIADTLRDEIVGGQYSIGDPFPKEFDLCDRFGVSRHTVRSALARLEREGLLDRHKATGTVIRSVEPGTAFIQKLASVDDLLQYPTDTRLAARTLETIRADAAAGVELFWLREAREHVLTRLLAEIDLESSAVVLAAGSPAAAPSMSVRTRTCRNPEPVSFKTNTFCVMPNHTRNRRLLQLFGCNRWHF